MPTLTPAERRAIRRVSQSSVVESLNVHYRYIKIKFKNGIIESWLLRKVNKKHDFVFPRHNWFKNYDIPTYLEFQRNELDDDYEQSLPYFVIQYSDIKKAGFCEIRLKVHELICQLLDEGWIDPSYMPEALERDKQRLLNEDISTYKNGIINAYAHSSKRCPGQVLMSNFMDWGSFSEPNRIPMKDAWNESKKLYYAINSLVNGGKDVTRSNIIRAMADHPGSNICGPKFINPLFYRNIIRDVLKLYNPTVLDLEPKWGSKAMATWLMAGKYYYTPDFGPFHSAAPELSKYFKTVMVEDDGTHKNVAFLSDLRMLEPKEVVQKLIKLKDRVDIIVAFVGKEHADFFKNNLPPTKIYEARLLPVVFKRIDYMVLYYQI